MALLIGGLLGFSCARGAKALGHQIAVTLFTIATSVRETINRHIEAFGISALLGILFLILAAAFVIFTPASAAAWASVASKIVGFAANLTLGLAAGVGTHVAWILGKPALRDSILCDLDMKRRTRRHLSKFVVVLVFVLGTVVVLPPIVEAAPSVWVIADDATNSVHPVQRKEVIAKVIQAAPERADHLHASFVEVIKFDEAVMLSESTWIPVPAAPPPIDCQRAKPDLSGVDGFILLSPGLIASKQQDAVAECIAQEHNKNEVYESEVRRFKARLETATKVKPRTNIRTRIASLVNWLVSRPEVVAIDVVTDGIDNGRMPLSGLRVPSQVQVTLIITLPNPARSSPTLDDVLAAADSWGHVPGIKVIGAGDYLGASTGVAGGLP
jgi:hypothetical protein